MTDQQTRTDGGDDGDGPFVAIGGDAAGLSAASKCARDDPDREAIVFEKGEWVSYAHCGMPYYVKGDVERLTDLQTLSPGDVTDRGVDLHRNHEVTGIDTAARTVTVAGPDGEREQPYGALLIGTGARAASPFDLSPAGAFTMHDMDAAAALRAYLLPESETDPGAVGDGYTDTDLVARYAAMEPPGTAAIVGGGYVGVEMAEAFRARGLEVHLFQRPDRLLPPFGPAVGERVADELADAGVTVHTGTEVRAIAGHGRVEGVTYAPAGDGADDASEGDDGGGAAERLDAELALVGVGVRPNAELAAAAGIETGESGAIATDAYGRTSAPGVYAAGDCAETRHAVTGEPAWVPLGLTANRAGRAIGATVAGDPTPVGDVAGTAVVKAFELGAGRTGILDPDRARAAGFDPVVETVAAGSRSGYYPGAAETTVTLAADRTTGRVLGAATVGTDRAAKRIDAVATALDADLSVGELERLDLGYAPPFSPVWDPVLVAAKVVGGKLE